MADNKSNEDQNDNNEWNFTLENSESHEVKPADNKRVVRSKKKTEKKLSLEERPRNTVSKTRSSLAKELRNKDEDLEKDVFDLASYANRFIALILDLAFTGFIVFEMNKVYSVLRKFMQMFLDQYRLQFIVPEAMIMKITYSFLGVIGAFFLIVIPVTFFNTSLGKKMVGLRVRGDDKYTLSLIQIFKRELIFKPIGLLFLIGFFMPFFNDKRQSLHDMLAGTIVIND